MRGRGRTGEVLVGGEVERVLWEKKIWVVSVVGRD